MKREFTFYSQPFKNFVRLALVVDLLFKTSSLLFFIYVGERFRSGSIAKVHRLSKTYVWKMMTKWLVSVSGKVSIFHLLHRKTAVAQGKSIKGINTNLPLPVIPYPFSVRKKAHEYNTAMSTLVAFCNKFVMKHCVQRKRKDESFDNLVAV